jgi:hypothetical protein
MRLPTVRSPGRMSRNMGWQNMRSRNMGSRAFLFLLLAGLIPAVVNVSGCRDGKLTSVWRGDHELVIDGQKDDWNGIDVYNFEDKNVYLGLANDSESIFILLVASNRALAMHVLREGLRVRFQPERSRHVLWIGTPLAAPMGYGAGGARGDFSREDGDVSGPGEERGRGGFGDRDGGGRMGGRSGPSDEMIRKAIADLPEEVYVYSMAGKDSLRLSSGRASRGGIEIRAGSQDGYAIIEIKAPLTKDDDHPHAVGIRPGFFASAGAGGDQEGESHADAGSVKGPTVEMNFKMPKFDSDMMAPGSRGERRPDDGGEGLNQNPGGDFPGGGGLGGGRFGRSGGPDMFPGKMINGLDMTVQVRLSRPR